MMMMQVGSSNDDNDYDEDGRDQQIMMMVCRGGWKGSSRDISWQNIVRIFGVHEEIRVGVGG